MNSFQEPVHDVIGWPEYGGRDDIDAKFEQAQQFVDAYWTHFDDPSGVSADLAELKRAVTGTGPANPMRTRLTLHRLYRIGRDAAPLAAVIAIVRGVLDPAH